MTEDVTDATMVQTHVPRQEANIENGSNFALHGLFLLYFSNMVLDTIWLQAPTRR